MALAAVHVEKPVIPLASSVAALVTSSKAGRGRASLTDWTEKAPSLHTVPPRGMEASGRQDLSSGGLFHGVPHCSLPRVPSS